MPRWIQILIFALVALSIWGGAHLYVLLRFFSAIPLAGMSRAMAYAAMITLLLLYPVSEILSRNTASGGSVALGFIASIWVGLLFYLFIFSLLLHGAELASRLTHITGSPPAAGSAMRQWMFGGVVTASVLFCAYGLYRAAAPAIVKSFDIGIKHLPEALDGFRITAISDIHLGSIVGAKRSANIVAQVNATSPDLVVIAGDLADEAASHLEDAVAPFRGVKARYGIIASTGNHDFYAGIHEVEQIAGAAGIRFLRNEHVVLADSLHVFALDDPAVSMTGRTFSIEQVVGPQAQNHPSILLFHQPLHYAKAAKLGIDLMVSGHTHNGQIWPFSALVRLAYRRVWGMYRDGGLSHYVSCGAGTWGPPMRVGAPPEVVVFNLKRKEP